jgi:NAD(P)-dependent dehydrogenase (short-subunit alcohol dehydrogenase family)
MKVVIDICDHASIDAALADIDSAGVKLTCLVNNAGYAQPGPIELVDDAQMRRQFEVNVFGTLAMTRAMLPRLRAQASAQRHGLIITLSSMLGLVSSPYQGIYAASKHALEGAFHALRMEVRAQHIDVALIEPGWISTQFLKTARTHAPASWLEHAVYGPSLKTYFAITDEAETEHPDRRGKNRGGDGRQRDGCCTNRRARFGERAPQGELPGDRDGEWMPLLARLLPTRTWDKLQTRQFTP